MNQKIIADFIWNMAGPDLLEFENMPFQQDIRVCIRSEMLPLVSDASGTILPSEINFNRCLYACLSPRPIVGATR